VTGERRRALRLAHRGDWRAAAENSIAAMVAALRIPGCDGLEFDVRTSRDGVPVLLHDATLARVQGIDADVADVAADELAGRGVPSLADVLAAVGPAPFLDVELKGMPAPTVVDVLEAARGPSLERAVVSSFDRSALEWLQERRPSWPRWLNSMSLSQPWLVMARELGCAGVSAQWTLIDEGGMARARDLGLEVAAWTVREPEACHHLERLGVIAICAEAEALDG
jgi:glycerophosphoryl diester phosphodiesterase